MKSSIRISRGGRSISFRGGAARAAFEAITGTNLPSSDRKPIAFRSRAEWPKGLEIGNKFEGDNTTCDRHDTEEQAHAVCRMLEREGFGGERIAFPVRTWVEPVFESA